MVVQNLRKSKAAAIKNLLSIVKSKLKTLGLFTPTPAHTAYLASLFCLLTGWSAEIAQTKRRKSKACMHICMWNNLRSTSRYSIAIFPYGQKIILNLSCNIYMHVLNQQELN